MLNRIEGLCRAVVVFVAASGFLFGQLFFASFDWPATVAGVGGLLAGVLGGGSAGRGAGRPVLVCLACGGALIGVGFDAYGYYSGPPAAGSYYAWFLIAPFCAGLGVIFALAARNAAAKPSAADQ